MSEQAKALVIIGIVTAVVVGLWLIGNQMLKKDGVSTNEYLRVRAICENRATVAVQGEGLYFVGGQHWADLVNKCMVDEVSR